MPLRKISFLCCILPVATGRRGSPTPRAADRRPVRLLTVLVVLTACWADAQSSSAGDSPKPRGTSQVRPADDRLQGLIHGLRRMDADESGSLEADEISDRARPYIERWARLADLDPSKPLPIPELEKALHQHYGNRQPPARPSPRQTRRPTPEAGSPVRGFGPDEDQPPIPGFGVEIDPSVVLLQADLDRAAERLRSSDRNRDGFIDRHEASQGRWPDDVFQYDANRDNRLSRRELAVRYARRRIQEARGRDRSPSRSDSGRRGRGSPEEAQRRGREEEERRRRQDPRTREAWYLSGSIMYRYDLNRNGSLEPNEFRNLGEKAASADADGRGRVDRQELVEWLLRVAERPERDLPPELPEWFRQRDADADAQVTMAEFAQQWSEDKVTQFEKYDLNSDGIITPEECVGASSLPEGTYRNHQLKIIPAGRTVYSEIVVPDGEPVSNLDVQISITHTYDAHLDAFLIAPFGQRIELFTAVGRDDDHFDNTLFDDEAQRSIAQAKPPFKGAYRPEAVDKRQPSLKQFYGKQIGGTWTLMIQAGRSDRPGALHGWALITTPAQNSQESERPEPDHAQPDRAQRDRSQRGRPERDRSEGSRPLFRRSRR